MLRVAICRTNSSLFDHVVSTESLSLLLLKLTQPRLPLDEKRLRVWILETSYQLFIISHFIHTYHDNNIDNSKKISVDL